MGEQTKIEWTDHTFNSHWGCQRVSPGCENCYAEAFSHRLGRELWGPKAERREFGDAHWAEPLKWNKAAERDGVRRRVFCASMADVFEDHPVAARSRERLWPLIIATPHLDWLLLTKRPQNLAGMLPWVRYQIEPPPNVWLGTTVEDQKRADERVPLLLAVPAVVRFLSCEPLLGRVDLTSLRDDEVGATWNVLEGMGLDWVIVGGESGPGARPFDLEWAATLVGQCQSFDVAVFVKQLGARPVETADHAEELVRLELVDRRKGGDWSEWPEDLRVREYPEARR